jgi:glycosyltransferase involved in cell wall biosynthesis
LDGWQVKIVGEGPYRKKLERMIQKYNLEKQVHFLGWLERSSSLMIELYGKASIFVLPSYFENYNVTLKEAEQSGCSIIATDSGGNGEVIKTAFFYQPGDINTLQTLLKQVMSKHHSNKANIINSSLTQSSTRDYEIALQNK